MRKFNESIGGIICEVTIDPMDKFPDARQQQMIAALTQVLVPWSLISVTHIEPVDMMQKLYGYPMYDSEKTVIDNETGMHSYSGDPDMAPIAVVKNTVMGNKIWMYEHELVSIEHIDYFGITNEPRPTGKYFSCRMD